MEVTQFWLIILSGGYFAKLSLAPASATHPTQESLFLCSSYLNKYCRAEHEALAWASYQKASGLPAEAGLSLAKLSPHLF